jgi:hypothetical protein
MPYRQVQRVLRDQYGLRRSLGQIHDDRLATGSLGGLDRVEDGGQARYLHVVSSAAAGQGRS